MALVESCLRVKRANEAIVIQLGVTECPAIGSQIEGLYLLDLLSILRTVYNENICDISYCWILSGTIKILFLKMRRSHIRVELDTELI